MAEITSSEWNQLWDREPKYAEVEWSTTSGDQTLVAAVTGKKILVLSLVFSADTGTNFDLKSGSDRVFGIAGPPAGIPVQLRSKYGIVLTDEGDPLVVSPDTVSSGSAFCTYLEV